MTKAQHQYSVTIICRDESRTIARVIKAALAITDDVVVVDSGSVDGSQALARNAGAQVYDYQWSGYGANKNYAATLAKYPWIISIDADEVINHELTTTIQALTPKRGTVYALNSIVSLGGQWIKYSGWHPVWKERIYHKEDVSWNEAEVHEKLCPTLGVTVEKLPGLLLHYSYKDLKDHQQRTLHYAELRAKQWISDRYTPGIIKRYLSPIARWIRTYVIKQGWRDGKMGLYIANSNARMIRHQVVAYDRLKKR